LKGGFNWILSWGKYWNYTDDECSFFLLFCNVLIPWVVCFLAVMVFGYLESGLVTSIFVVVVVVHGVEYGFGAHERDTTGIFEVEPRRCPGFTFRKSIFIGSTDMGARDVRELMERMAEDYSGNTYHLIQKNCNHFCDDVCVKLTGKSTPRWVNRLARLGKGYLLSPSYLYKLILHSGVHVVPQMF